VSLDAMAAAADRIWASLDEDAWREAFAAHPRIGAGRAGESGEAGGADLSWAAGEQAGVADAPRDVRERLATANRDYEARFGYIFIVCATGKTADEMLAIIERRLHNEPDVELRVAAEEQRKITRLRLEKLLGADPSPSP